MLFGKSGEGLQVIDSLLAVLYPGDARKRKTKLMMATAKALEQIINSKPADWNPQTQAPNLDDIAEFAGEHIAKGFEKRTWVAAEVLRMHREGEADDAKMEE